MVILKRLNLQDDFSWEWKYAYGSKNGIPTYRTSTHSHPEEKLGTLP
jgi:hypothetical protein